jgi:glycosyltransferase involved in cell wall biosynthesis
MMPGVSIIMTPHNRTNLLMVTLESIWAQNYPDLEIIVVEDRPTENSLGAFCGRNKIQYAARKSQVEGWMNPAPLLNHGLKRATKEIVVFQNAECRHESLDCIERLVEPIVRSQGQLNWEPPLSVSACVQSLNRDGSFAEWYVHPNQGNRQGWISPFCQALPRASALNIQGFEEEFKNYGYEDDLFEFMLRESGVRLTTTLNALVSHMWHPKFTGDQRNSGEGIYKRICCQIKVGERPPIANWRREWGNI